MKKILFVALGATLLAAGCQKTEVINPVGNAISFTTGMDKLTKADGTAAATASGEANLQAQDFRVWAYNVAANANTGDAALSEYDGMVNSPVTYTPGAEGATGTWSTDKQYYWPGQGKELKFFAVSADLATVGTGTESKVTINDARTELTITEFVVNHLSPNTDLMVADFVQQSQDEKKTVDLTFRHTLAKVEFLFKTNTTLNTPVWVQEVSVENINTKATLNVGGDNPGWSDLKAPEIFKDSYQKAATDTDLPTDLVKIDTEATVDTDAMTLTDDPKTFATWMLIPQTIKSTEETPVTNLQVKVIYVMGNRQFEASFPLAAENLTAWSANQYVKYTVTLTPNLISFVPTVSPWTPTGEADDDATADANKDVAVGN